MQTMNNLAMAEEESTNVNMQSDGQGPNVVLRFLISSKSAGLIIGKEGDNIKKLRKEYNAKINIPDSNCAERVLSIDGELSTVLEVIEQILDRLQSQQNSESGADLRLLVHSSQAGCVIGKSGSKIRELRENSGLRILKVYQLLCPGSTDRVIQMVGEVDKVVACLHAIAELLEDSPPRGARVNYDARHVNEAIVSEYGGWGTTGVGGMARRGAAGAPYNPAFFGAARGGDQLMFNGVSMGHMPRGTQGNGPGGDASTATAMMAAGMMRGVPSRVGLGMINATTTTQVSVSDKMIGAIMGRQGSRINQVRQESGADIKISNQEPGAEDRIITITGTPDQIQNAQFLLQVCVKRYGEASM